MIKIWPKKKKKNTTKTKTTTSSSKHLFSVFFNKQTLQWMLIGNVYNMTTPNSESV